MDQHTNHNERVILVVEDDFLIGESLCSLVEEIAPGVRSILKLSAKEAREDLERLRDSCVLIISDYHLVGQETGLDFFGFCEKNFPRVPFVLMTASTHPQMTLQLNALSSPPAILRKPFTLEACIKVIKTAVGSA